MLGHTEVLGRVGRREDDMAPVIEVALGLTLDEELAPGVDGKHAVKLLLFMAHELAIPELHQPYKSHPLRSRRSSVRN